MAMLISLSIPNCRPRGQEEAKEVTVCMFTSNNMDGQKRIWLSQLEHLQKPPYSPSNDGKSKISTNPLKFVVFMSTESAVAPDEEKIARP